MPTTDARYITAARVRDIDQWCFTIAIIGRDLIETALHRPRPAVLLCRVNHISRRTGDIKTGINVKKFTDISSFYYWFLLSFTIRLNKYAILIARWEKSCISIFFLLFHTSFIHLEYSIMILSKLKYYFLEHFIFVMIIIIVFRMYI